MRDAVMGRPGEACVPRRPGPGICGARSAHQYCLTLSISFAFLVSNKIVYTKFSTKCRLKSIYPMRKPWRGETQPGTVEFFRHGTETWDLSTDRGVSRQKRYGSLYMYHMDSS